MPENYHRPFLNVLLIFSIVALGLFLHYVISLHYGLPVPTIHDEFAYLCSADTFAQGRLSNTTHPMWEHFQTFHVFFQPTYQSKFPPLQGMFMGFGQRVLGAPIWGVWISMALAYGAVFWLFVSVVKPMHAMVGTLMVVIHPFIVLHWGQTYWGGGVALLGGALYFGGIRHTLKKITLANTFLLAVGLIVLANSRPFEGLVVFAVSTPMLVKIALNGFGDLGHRETVKRYLLPLGIMGGLTVVWVCYYNSVLTGHPFKFYYLNWDAQSTTIDMIRHYKGSPQITYWQKLLRLWDFFVGPYLSVAAIGLWLVLRRGQMVFELICIIVLVATSLVYSRAWPHYFAPVAGVFYLMVFMGLCEIKRIPFIRSDIISHILFIAVLVVYFVIAASGTYAFLEKGPARPFIAKLHVRKKITDNLKGLDGKDLILVSYGKNHNSHEEWVYNRADIDNAEIVWARDLGKEKTKRLLEYYSSRTVWQLFPDQKPVGFIKIRDAAP